MTGKDSTPPPDEGAHEEGDNPFQHWGPQGVISAAERKQVEAIGIRESIEFLGELEQELARQIEELERKRYELGRAILRLRRAAAKAGYEGMI